MRSALLVPCALMLAVGGCRGASRRPPPADQIATPAEDAPPPDAAGPPAPAAAVSTDDDPAASPPLSLRSDSPAMRYARLGRDACLAELGRRHIAFEEVPPTTWTPRSRTKAARVGTQGTKGKQAASASRAGAKRASPAKRSKPGKAVKPAKRAGKATAGKSRQDHVDAPPSILAPVRLRGPVHGIAIHSSLPEKVRAKSTIEIVDCRLVLALDDFASMLSKEHDVVEIVHMSAFRSQRDRGCTPKYPGKQHCGALALDVGVFKKRDGSTLNVDRDWNGRIGMTTCTGGTGPSPETPAAKELWEIVCDAAERGLFHVVLTPNFNAEHKNHFHVEVTPDVSWMLIH